MCSDIRASAFLSLRSTRRKSLGRALEELRERLNIHGTPLENILGPLILDVKVGTVRYLRYRTIGLGRISIFHSEALERGHPKV